jgi:hypothetical protein
MQMLSVVAMEAAGAPRVSRRRAAPPRGAVKQLDYWMKTSSHRWMKEGERLLSENDDVLNTNMKRCFFSIQVKFHQTIQLSNNFSSHLLFPHPTIQQLFIPSIISSSNYPTTFHPF